MPTGEEANARSQPAEGLPSLRNRRQVRGGAGRGGRAGGHGSGEQQPAVEGSSAGGWVAGSPAAGALPARTRGRVPHALSSPSPRLLLQVCTVRCGESVPHTRVSREEAARQPALLHLPKIAAAPGHPAPAARPAGAAGACPKLPPLPTAPSAQSAGDRGTASGTAAGRDLVPDARGQRCVPGSISREESWRAAPHRRRTIRSKDVEDAAHAVVQQVLDTVFGARQHGTRVSGNATAAGAAKVQVSQGGQVPTARPAPGPCARRGSSGAAGQAPAPAPPGRAAGPGQLQQQQQDQEQRFSRTCARQALVKPQQVYTVRCGESVPHTRVSREEAARQPALLHLPKIAAAPGHPAPAARPAGAAGACPKLPPLPTAPSAPSAGDRGTASGTAAGRDLVPDARGSSTREGSQRAAPNRRALRVAHVVETARCIVDEVLNRLFGACQGPSQQPVAKEEEKGLEDITIHSIWVNPAVAELLQDPHAGPLAAGGTDGTPTLEPPQPPRGVAGEAAADLQSASPAPEGPTEAQPTPPAVAGAAKGEEHRRTPRAPTTQEDEEAASPVRRQQDPAAQAAESQPAPQSPTALEAALQATVKCLVSEVLQKVLAGNQRPGQQPVDQQDRPRCSDAATQVTTAAAPADKERAPAAEPRDEASAAPRVPAARVARAHGASPAPEAHRPGEAAAALVSPAAREGEAASPSPPDPAAGAGAPHLSPAAREGEAASPSPPDPAAGAGTPHLSPAAREGEAVSPSPPDPAAGAGTPHLSPAAREGEAVSPSPPDPAAGAGTPHLAPAAREGEAVSPSPPDPAAGAGAPRLAPASATAGAAALPHAPAAPPRPSLFRRALRALRRALRCSCLAGQPEEQERPAASAP
ncbi:mediator of DNA damage checkpoint protein 1-like isoform X2 [Tyto alba]|uniref:mediator of DNA damage checkpoint protein 1-like isoform X2 n=1 Tax=Tyto alba TaxID=56313 RepID=UPI001C6689EF|nr:mediator of DNA damage checkpoint protein 1-like isoform X2 [Tyto alba]